MRAFVVFALFIFLSMPLLFAQNSSTSPPSRGQEAASGEQRYSFLIPAGQVWLDTNIDLNPGDLVHVTGAVLGCGGPKPFEKAHVLTSSAPVGVVVARLQANAQPVSATPDAEFSIVEPSHLYLGVNGWQCSGNVPARVSVQRGGAASGKR